MKLIASRPSWKKSAKGYSSILVGSRMEVKDSRFVRMDHGMVFTLPKKNTNCQEKVPTNTQQRVTTGNGIP